MSEPNEGTAPTTGEAQTPPAAAAPAAAPAPATGTPPTPDEVTTLRSRNAGLDAKVTELQRAAAAEKARADAAEARALELAAGKANGDEELRAQLEREKAEAAAARQEAKLARIEAKYPETFGVLGAAAASLSDDQLAASEARMKGVPAPVETPVPVPAGTNPPRTVGGTKAIEDMSVKELEAHLRTLPRSEFGLG